MQTVKTNQKMSHTLVSAQKKIRILRIQIYIFLKKSEFFLSNGCFPNITIKNMQIDTYL